jgi:hypothetical protein
MTTIESTSRVIGQAEAPFTHDGRWGVVPTEKSAAATFFGGRASTRSELMPDSHLAGADRTFITVSGAATRRTFIRRSGRLVGRVRWGVPAREHVLAGGAQDVMGPPGQFAGHRQSGPMRPEASPGLRVVGVIGAGRPRRVLGRLYSAQRNAPGPWRARWPAAR